MSRRAALKRCLGAVVAVIAALSAVLPASAEGDRGIHRSIQQLVKAQGTYCFVDPGGGCTLYDPPVANYIYFASSVTNWVGAVDYAGLEDRWLKAATGGHRSFHTEFSGSVIERPLADGRAEIAVHLQTENEAVRVFLLPDTLLFGNRTPSVLAGARPAFGESTLDFDFINPKAGMPLPDLAQIGFAPFPGQEFVTLHIRAVATGPLHAASGFPEGSRGRMTMDMISTAANPSAREVLTLTAINEGESP
jgi:hypothetical protein